MALRRLRDAAGVEDAAKLEAEAAEAAKAVDAHRRSVGKAWPVAPRYLRHGGDREEVVAGTDSLGNNARVVPPPLQQQPSLENATRWPVDAVLARLRAHLAMGRRDPRFGLKTATQELRRLVFVLQPPVADSLGPRELCRLFAALGLRITDHQGQAILDTCAAPAGLSINSMGTLARAASQHKVAPPPTQQMNATQQRRCLVETPPPPPPSPPRKPKAQEEATLGHDLADYINDDDGAHPPSNRPESPEPHNQTNPRPPTAGRNARRARRRQNVPAHAQGEWEEHHFLSTVSRMCAGGVGDQRAIRTRTDASAGATSRRTRRGGRDWWAGLSREMTYHEEFLRQSILHRSSPGGCLLPELLLDVADEDDEKRDEVVDLHDVGAGVVEHAVELGRILAEHVDELDLVVLAPQFLEVRVGLGVLAAVGRRRLGVVEGKVRLALDEHLDRRDGAA